MKILVTGGAGFIGSEIAIELARAGHQVIVVDNMDDYYSVELKSKRLEQMSMFRNMMVLKEDINDPEFMHELFTSVRFDMVYHLAGQPGVIASRTNPGKYTKSNLTGFAAILEACRHSRVKHLVFASSSSVYGDTDGRPSVETDPTDSPKSYYAATKKANEVMAKSYSHLYGMKITGCRFFTAYGPYGRPDMGIWKFAKAILLGHEISLRGVRTQRAFTYIDDVTKCLMAFSDPENANQARKNFEIYNVGTETSVNVGDCIFAMEKLIGIKAVITPSRLEDDEVFCTLPDSSKLLRHYGVSCNTPLEEGLEKFIDWYKNT